MKRMLSTPRNGRRGAELVEFALVLPFLLLLIMGIFDFGSLFALRQKMTNAAREGARIVVSTPLTDTSCSTATPCSTVAAVNAVVQYMTNAGVNVSCIHPASPTTSTTLMWTYSCTNGTSLVINRGYAFPDPGGTLVPATQVTFVYPIEWRLISFLPDFSRYTTLTTQATMQNLVGN